MGFERVYFIIEYSESAGHIDFGLHACAVCTQVGSKEHKERFLYEKPTDANVCRLSCTIAQVFFLLQL